MIRHLSSHVDPTNHERMRVLAIKREFYHCRVLSHDKGWHTVELLKIAQLPGALCMVQAEHFVLQNDKVRVLWSITLTLLLSPFQKLINLVLAADVLIFLEHVFFVINLYWLCGGSILNWCLILRLFWISRWDFLLFLLLTLLVHDLSSGLVKFNSVIIVHSVLSYLITKIK